MISVIAAAWLLPIAFFDARKRSIPDVLNISFLLFAVFVRAIDGSLSIISLLIAAGFFGVQWILSRGRAIGSGDVLLAAGIGALLFDMYLLMLWIIISYAPGAAIVSVLLLTKRKKFGDTIAFAPFLSVAAIITLFLGENILNAIGFG